MSDADATTPASKASNEPVTISLRKPITFANRTIAQLTIRAPKAKDLRRIKDSTSALEDSLNLASWCSGEVKEVIDELEGDDLREVLGVVNRFFRNLTAPGTGDPPSGS